MDPPVKLRRKFVQHTLPTVSFRDGVLSVPGYRFDKAVPWDDTGSSTLLAEGSSLKDGSSVLAKIAAAHSNGSMCLEREAHIIGRLSSSPEGMSTPLRMIDFLNIDQENGDCVVLLVVHPGLNLLGRYFPPSRVNDLLVADVSRARPSSYGDVFMAGMEEPESTEEQEVFDIMDLASFLEFAIQATHCLEVLHRSGLMHREVRANAFHLNAHTGVVRIVHFGNRSISLEQLGGPSALVISADAFEEVEKRKVKEAVCYLAPEQTGSVDTVGEDHRTDLYSLGIMFWTLLVGHGTMPFDGGPMELLHSIAQKRPMPVHEVRRDLPQVLAAIIDKLLSKNPDGRYNSAYGLKADLMECQKRLLVSVTSMSEQSSDLIPFFEIASEDRFLGFTIPSALFGREKEVELIRNVIKHTSTSYARQSNASKTMYSSSSGTVTGQTAAGDDHEQSSSIDSVHSSASPHIHTNSPTVNNDLNPKVAQIKLPSVPEPDIPASAIASPTMTQSIGNGSAANSGSAGNSGSDQTLRRIAVASGRVTRARAIVVIGPAGAGKSALILSNQAKWRSHGLWGHAKFQAEDSSPFAALLSCLSSVLRQLMVFRSDLHRFVAALRLKLGPQLRNVPLLYHGAPELRDVLNLFDIDVDVPQEYPDARELRARFQSLVENVFTVLAEVRLLAIFLDDVHEADDSSLEVVGALANSKSRLLLLISARSDSAVTMDRMRTIFASRTRTTWIELEPLPFSAILSLVSKTLHRQKESCVPLARLVHRLSSGNAFSARNILTTLQRQNLITFEWESNSWRFDLDAIEANLVDQDILSDPSDINYLVSHLRNLPEDARKYIVWAGFFGSTFKVTEVALMIDWDYASNHSSSGSEEENDQNSWNLSKAVSDMRDTTLSVTRGAARGLQIAISEGWLVQRARDMAGFTHDRYRQAAQAEAASLPRGGGEKMAFRIVLMLLHDSPPDAYRIAEYSKRCVSLIQEHPRCLEIMGLVIDAGDAAWARGAHELALQSLTDARTLLSNDMWEKDHARALDLHFKLAELLTWKGDCAGSDGLLEICFNRVVADEDKAKFLRLRSRNHWVRKDFSAALDDTLLALHALGVDISANPGLKAADVMFEEVKDQILAMGFDHILSIPRATDPRIELATSLLNDASTNAFWSAAAGFADIIGLTTIQLALRHGMCPGTSIGFFYAITAAAEKRELYRFSADLGRLALRLADKHGGSLEKCRAQVLFCALVSGFDNVHIRATIARCEMAVKYGNSAGDRIFAGFAAVHAIQGRLFTCDHLEELATAAVEVVNDVRAWTPGADTDILAMGLLNCIRALGGYTIADSPATAFDTETFTESEYALQIRESSGNVDLSLNWYNSFKVVALFGLGFVIEAAELGFTVYETRHTHPNHRHTRYAICYHSLALIACIRNNDVTSDNLDRYTRQIELNQEYIRKWLSPSPVNTSTWVALVDAELASLNNDPDTFKLYDIAVKLAVNHDWILEEGWGLYLQGCHFVRCGVEGLGRELQRRGISRQAQWGARGIVNQLTSLLGARCQYPLKRNLFTADVAIQTESVVVDNDSRFRPQDESMEQTGRDSGEEEEMATLTAQDLAAILKWSKEISSDINLTSALQRLTEIAAETSGAQRACVVIAREAGDYTLATSLVPPELCQVYENPRPLRSISDPLQRAIIQHSINTKGRLYFEDVSLDPRFSNEAEHSAHSSVICIPILSNRGQTFGAVYLVAKYAFPRTVFTILSMLFEQASISISNALLFRSVQGGTRENLKMIASQRSALETARKSREDALKATKIKSNFLASMSHELRTPFSSFYGLLDLLSGTELNAGQREIVQTAKQSCELLLKIIDSILDYSKLEASALKLEFSGFAVEDLIADCMELLLPMAAKKLDMSYNIEPDVPSWILADYARIRQVLMNLLGNAVKFTASGSVCVTCSLDTQTIRPEGQVSLKFVIRDTGIGMSSTDIDLLFMPFHQADNSSTRRFGGTGLGLSISRQLVKLMGGEIGVESETGVGSLFWFTLPVKLFESDESRQAQADLANLKAQLMTPQPPRIVFSSPSKATQSLLRTMFSGFPTTTLSNIDELEAYAGSDEAVSTPPDFIILDHQSEGRVDELARTLQAASATHGTKIIHVYTPTSETLSRHPTWGNTIPGLVRLTKPPRQTRVLRTMAGLRDLPGGSLVMPTTEVAAAVQDLASVQRRLYGNVLVAEDNPVARQLLIKQLERYNLSVTATTNGNEAIEEWEKHDPDYFSVALFDHHMPICDGVEAAKRLRVIENRRKAKTALPIVALSADCQESTKQLCLSAGMNAFLSKPLKKSDLLSLLSMFESPASSTL